MQPRHAIRSVAIAFGALLFFLARTSTAEDAALEIENLAASFTPGNSIEITYLSRRTFIVTDAITLRATLQGADPGATVYWTVTGQGAAAGIGGFPINEARPTVGNDVLVSEFRFIPAASTQLRTDRHTRWTQGRCPQPNPPIAFEVTARASIGGNPMTASLANTNHGPLSQDEQDCLRQEYFDYDGQIDPTTHRPVNMPEVDRYDDPTPTSPYRLVPRIVVGGWNLNGGNYSNYQLSIDLPGHYSRIVSTYRALRNRPIRLRYNGQTYNHAIVIAIPSNAAVTITSAYRNPQRNRSSCVGSLHPLSKHVLGQAIDLVPQPFDALVQLRPGTLPITITRLGADDPHPLFALLAMAVEAQPDVQLRGARGGLASGCELGTTKTVTADCYRREVNQVHVQWLLPNSDGLVEPQSAACYANCDESMVPPVLNVADFTCFLQRYAAGESYANCDGSTIPPVLNVADFTCFLQRFAAGCP
jgi:hypothetical protein